MSPLYWKQKRNLKPCSIAGPKCLGTTVVKCFRCANFVCKGGCSKRRTYLKKGLQIICSKCQVDMEKSGQLKPRGWYLKNKVVSR